MKLVVESLEAMEEWVLNAEKGERFVYAHGHENLILTLERRNVAALARRFNERGSVALFQRRNREHGFDYMMVKL